MDSVIFHLSKIIIGILKVEPAILLCCTIRC